MARTLQKRIAELEAMDRTALTAEWETCFGTTPPSRTSPGLMVRALAHHWQEQKHGGLSQRYLKALAAVITQAAPPKPVSTQAESSSLIPGTRLVRDWHGQHIEISVDPAGRFLWQGRSYRSLSAIAREVTGSPCNGPRFFGLRSPEA
jgi:hypothetical protein